MRRNLWVAATLAAAVATACSSSSPSSETPPLTVSTGGCCGDPNACRSNICAPSLHCGSSQSPTAVYVCCANGSFCCTTDSDCQAHVPGGACNTATSTCYTDCATDDDSHCAAASHCEGSTCLADVTSGACDEPSDCGSGNCSADFDPGATTSTCAPAGECASGNQSWPVGYTLCTGSSFWRRCDTAGAWSAPTPNPTPAGQPCDVGAGAATGFRAPATCTSGLDAVDPGFVSSCVSCAPYRATAAGCPVNCGGNDLNCWPGNHCSAHAGDSCVSNANGSSCDVDGECSTGRCTIAFLCAEKLLDGGSCAKSSDCTSGWCNGTVCAAKKANTVQCSGDVECQSGHCSNDFDTLGFPGYCAPAGTCARNGNAYLPSWVQCNASTSTSTFARTCNANGLWIPKGSFTSGACAYGSLGWPSGYLTATCATGSSAAGLTSVCQSCSGYAPNATVNGCQTSCSGTNDAACAGAYYCNGSACVPQLANNAACARDRMCASDRCDPTCQPKLQLGEYCDEDRDCLSTFCYSGVCEDPY